MCIYVPYQVKERLLHVATIRTRALPQPGPEASKATGNGDLERPSIPEKNLAWLSKEHIKTSQQKT